MVPRGSVAGFALVRRFVAKRPPGSHAERFAFRQSLARGCGPERVDSPCTPCPLANNLDLLLAGARPKAA